ncbi:ribonuclease H-like YkuK family protein [Cohnella boryungensis]|uniref:Ribonuclease H-like YkuK family protein n=1 Tax=Cohnella boryungensis TaxID=768479 RepID=A0ABV8S6L9_9BACL
MAMMRAISKWDDLCFQNLTESGLYLDQVEERILRFIAKDPQGVYQFIIGTDSQVHRQHTKFVTGIVIHRVGRGAWACYRQMAVPRQLTSIREKLLLETSFSQRVATYFDETALRRMEQILLPYARQGSLLDTFIDIDAGIKPASNKTAAYVEEMVERVESMGLYAPRVKPEACVASSYANRYTKQ